MDFLEKFRAWPEIVKKPLLTAFTRLGGKYRKWADMASRSLESRYFGVSVYDRTIKDQLYSADFRECALQHDVASHFEPFYSKVQSLSTQQKMQYVDYKTWLVDDLLIKADRMSMAASLELRVPFLDHRLVEFAATIPAHYRTKNNESKYLLKKALEPHLPRDVLYRKKMGFPTPLARLFSGPLQNYVSDILQSTKCRQRGLFNSQFVDQLLREHHQKKADHHRVLWQLLVLELWQQEFLP